MAPTKDKIDITITDTFKKILNKSGRKSWVQIPVDKDSELYKKYLQNKNIEIHLTYDEGKYIFAERFIRTLKNKFNKYISSISKNAYFDELVDIVKTYNNTFYKTIKMKPTDIKSKLYINFHQGNNYTGHKFKAGDYVKISKCKKVFAKASHSNVVRSFCY